MTTRATGPMNSKADDQVLADTKAAIERGEDPFGDNDDAPAAATPAAEAPAEENPATVAELSGDEADETPAADGQDDADSEGGTTDEAGAAAADDTQPADDSAATEDEPPAAPLPKYTVGDAEAIKEERKQLLADKAKALKDMMDGVIDPDAYSAREAEIQQALDDLLVRKTLHEANVQSEQQANTAAINAIIQRAKKAGEIDYQADEKAQRQFDTALNMLAQDPDEASTPRAELLEKAHAAVLAVRGIAKKPAAAAAPAPTPAKPRENGKGPITLRNVPAAEMPNSGGGIVEEMGRLTGVAYQEAYERLTPAQKARLLED